MSICRVRNVKIRSKPALPVPTLPLRHGLSHAGDGYDPVPLAGTGHKAGLMSDEQSKSWPGSRRAARRSTSPSTTTPSRASRLRLRPTMTSSKTASMAFCHAGSPSLWTPKSRRCRPRVGFVSPSGEWRLEGNKRPSWIQIQPPVDLAVGFFTKALSQPAATRQFIVWSLSIDHNQDLIGGELFAAGWGQSLSGGPISPIDGDNLVFVNVQRLGVEQYAVTLNVTEAGVNTITQAQPVTCRFDSSAFSRMRRRTPPCSPRTVSPGVMVTRGLQTSSPSASPSDLSPARWITRSSASTSFASIPTPRCNDGSAPSCLCAPLHPAPSAKRARPSLRFVPTSPVRSPGSAGSLRPVRANGRIRLRFSQPPAEPLNLVFWAALTEQPFPREYTDTAPAGAREFVWPRGRYAVTTLRRIKSSAAPGADQRLQLDFLQWTAQLAGEASHLVCGFYSDAAPGPASVGYFAPF